MPSIKNRELLEIVGVLTVVVSLGLVWYELRQGRLVALTETSAQANEINFNVRELITENADVWQRGCLAEELSESERVMYSQMFRAYEHLSFIEWRRASIGLVGRNPDALVRRISLNRYRFPGFNDAWIKSTKIPDPSFEQIDMPIGSWNRAIQDSYESYVESGTETNVDVFACGLP